ncbi:MAG: RDD family protein [Bacteroidetes bacterium]|nr:RDD family protein [Bacteroidota bacterium]MBP9797013.1 RDD family protein [Chitinophagales bacterium]
MRTIDILTTQNVTINYELAEVRDRLFAYVIDLLILVVGLVILTRVIMATGIFANEDYVLYFVVFPILFFYHFAFEILLDGQSPGKRMLGIKVVKLTGTEPSLNDYLMRWAMRPLDIFFSLGSIGIMLISSSEKGQRLGDIVANTAVIKTNPSQRIVLSDILNIRSIENYVPVYPNVREFTEPEMLLLKEVMDKSIKYQNDAHDDALNEAADIARIRLNMERAPADKIGFIKTLIKDFVALSR